MPRISPLTGRRIRHLFRSGHAYDDIAALLATVEPKGLCLDLPAGSGVNIEGIRAAGFEPVAADIFPREAASKGVPAVLVDFTEPLPFADSTFAAVLCSEGIEHCSRQLDLLREFHRILKPGGALLITTPNILNLRARLAWLLAGHRYFKGEPVNEATYLRGFSQEGRPYIGHVFLASYYVLRFMLRMVGFERLEVATAKHSATALALAPLLWLPVWATTRVVLARLRRQGYGAVAAEIARHVLSPDLLFGKKLLLLARKPGIEGGRD